MKKKITEKQRKALIDLGEKVVNGQRARNLERGDPLNASRGTPPRGEDAMIPDVTTSQIASKRSEELLYEHFKKLINGIKDNGDVDPIIIGKIDGKFIAAPLKQKDGAYQMPDLLPPSRLQLFHRKHRVNRIVKSMEKSLRQQVGDVVRISLMRKDDDDLKKLEIHLRKKKHDPPQLRNRVGCVFLEFGDESMMI